MISRDASSLLSPDSRQAARARLPARSASVLSPLPRWAPMIVLSTIAALLLSPNCLKSSWPSRAHLSASLQSCAKRASARELRVAASPVLCPRPRKRPSTSRLTSRASSKSPETKWALATTCKAAASPSLSPCSRKEPSASPAFRSASSGCSMETVASATARSAVASSLTSPDSLALTSCPCALSRAGCGSKRKPQKTQSKGPGAGPCTRPATPGGSRRRRRRPWRPSAWPDGRSTCLVREAGVSTASATCMAQGHLGGGSLTLFE
mmetsp:Transcript_80302/g.236210  ORF Transcript_80302/g.236210 Transcript_80302/m.236210 type:complete len:266 (-) Transcript_80302:3-800(-)